MATKAELAEELETLTTKADLVEILGSKLLKDDLVSLLEDESGATKEELVHKLESRRKDELIEAVTKHLNKDDLEKVVDERRPDEEPEADDEAEDETDDEQEEPRAEGEDDQEQDDEESDDAEDDADERDEPRAEGKNQQSDDDESQEDGESEEDEQSAWSGSGGESQKKDDSNENNGSQVRRVRDESTDIDWSAELDWAPPPRPTPAPVMFSGAAPFQPGQRVRVDLSGLPSLGVFAGKGASGAGTITGVDAQARMVRVYLDAVFGGEKEIYVPPERVQPDT